MTPIADWFRSRGWTPFAFQRETWDAYAHGESGLVHAPTGAGKSYAVWGGPISETLAPDGDDAPPLRVLWITPLRALANDTMEALRRPLDDLDLPWRLELRTGDTSQAVRRRQRERLPTALVTTPESLSLLLSYADAPRAFRTVRCVVVDEWHELLGSKRGVQTELCLARLRRLAPGLCTWGLSATLGNIDEARAALLGPRSPGRIVRGEHDRRVDVETLRPETIERFPWSGHLGLRLLPQVVAALEGPGSTLLFTNTRSQAEIWFRALTAARPDWLGALALHHGSLDRGLRIRVETMLREGGLRCVVCTSSLDLGVDFPPVEQVIQVGSPKGIARLLQRAGRSGHQPGATSRLLGVPTHALQLVEFAAARDEALAALAEGDGARLEQRDPVERPLDVLAQHLVTLGLGGGFDADETLAAVRSTRSYRDITDDEWRWTIDFLARGGPALQAYPEFARLTERDGHLVVDSREHGRRHRLSIGTITGDGAMQVRVERGARLGTIEERFIARLRAGDQFVFAGHHVTLVRVRGLTAYVRRTRGKTGRVPRWSGGRSPLSTQLAEATRRKLDDARRGSYDGPEMALVRPLLELQARWSRIPAPDELLIERTREGRVHHVFIFSFEGRLVHEGLSALVAHRITRLRPCSIGLTGNDYGIELVSRDPLDFDDAGWRELLSPRRLLEDLLECLNSVELARQRFRGIAQIAGLIFPGFPGQPKSTRQVQASSDLFYDVFREYDPANLLLDQARREVLDRELEIGRLRRALERLDAQDVTIVETQGFTPLAFPLWVEHMRSQQVSSESWQTRVDRMVARLERAADRTRAHPIET